MEPQTHFVIDYYMTRPTQPRFYLDIGAHDGITINNTLPLEKMGWKGICVEANPNIYPSLVLNRKCLSLNAAISNTIGTDDFLSIIGYSEMLSGLMSCYDARHLARIEREVVEHNQTTQVFKIPVTTISEIIDANKIQRIDYLSIDVEGAEANILNGIDWNKDGHKIRLISLEDNFQEMVGHEILTCNGYKHLARIGADNFYAR